MRSLSIKAPTHSSVPCIMQNIACTGLIMPMQGLKVVPFRFIACMHARVGLSSRAKVSHDMYAKHRSIYDRERRKLIDIILKALAKQLNYT